MQNITEWLNQEPDESEIRVRDGARYIPYHIIVEKLNKLCEDGGSWSTKNFRHLYHNMNVFSKDKKVTMHKTIVSASVEVVVRYNAVRRMDEEIRGVMPPYAVVVERTLSGAATFLVNGASNPHLAATCKSLAIMNAVKVWRQFGYGLNGFETEEEYFPEEPPLIEEATPNQHEMIEQINSCTELKVLESYKLIARGNPDWNAAYRTKLIQLQKEEQ